MRGKKNLTTSSVAVSVQFIERRIYLIRGHKVMIDVDLAELYQVPTKPDLSMMKSVPARGSVGSTVHYTQAMMGAVHPTLPRAGTDLIAIKSSTSTHCVVEERRDLITSAIISGFVGSRSRCG